MVVSFDPDEHAYYDEAGARLPNITSMMLRAGIVDDRWFTEESRDRGTAVHILAARYDLGVLDVASYDDLRYKGWLLAYVDAMRKLRPTWDRIEQPMACRRPRFAGTPDRVGHAWKLHTIMELKSGPPSKSQQVQTALQAILVADHGGLPAEHYQRLCLHVDKRGRFKLDHHKNLRDFDVARDVLRQCSAS